MNRSTRILGPEQGANPTTVPANPTAVPEFRGDRPSDPAPLGITISRKGATRPRPLAPRLLAPRPLAPRPSPARPQPSRAPAAVEIADFERIEDYLRAYLEGERFRSIHPLACGRWLVAWEMLWCADSKAKVLAVGSRADDAIGAFSASLLEQDSLLAYPQWPDLLVDGASPVEPFAVLTSFTATYRPQLGEDRCELLEGLFDHWRALAGAMRRHESETAAAGERVRWEDGRRLVLFTALVMVEIDRSLG